MKTKYLILFLYIVILNLPIYAQDAKGVAYYGHKESLGLGAPKGVDYNAYLVFDNSSAQYVYAKDSLEGGHIDENVDFQWEADGILNIVIKRKKTFSKGLINHTLLDSRQLLSREDGPEYVKENIPKINWKLSVEEKQIGNFTVKRATAKYRGRDYTAWYAPDLALPFGPWKLQGLPGLILEAYDTNKEVYFYFKSLEYPSKTKLDMATLHPEEDGMNWIDTETYKTKLINLQKEAIEKGRMIGEQFDAPSKLTNADIEKGMYSRFIEVFRMNE